MSKILEDLRYADSHEWVKLEGDIATIGISDYAQHALGNIVYVDMPEVGEKYHKVKILEQLRVSRLPVILSLLYQEKSLRSMKLLRMNPNL